MKMIIPIVVAVALLTPATAHASKQTLRSELTALQKASRGGALPDVGADGERLAACLADHAPSHRDARTTVTLEQLTAATLAYTPDRAARTASKVARRITRVTVRSRLARTLRALGAGGYRLQAQMLRLQVPAPEVACAQWTAVLREQQPAPQWLLSVTDTAQALGAYQSEIARADRAVRNAGLPRSLTPSGGLFA